VSVFVKLNFVNFLSYCLIVFISIWALGNGGGEAANAVITWDAEIFHHKLHFN